MTTIFDRMMDTPKIFNPTNFNVDNTWIEFYVLPGNTLSPVPKFYRNGKKIFSLFGCFSIMDNGVEYRYINPFPNMQSLEQRTLEYNTKTKQMNLIVEYMKSQQNMVTCKYPKEHHDHFMKLIKTLSDDNWWMNAMKLSINYKAHNANFKKFNKMSSYKSLTHDEVEEIYKYKKPEYPMKAIPKQIRDMMRNYQYVNGYRLAESGNLRLLEINDSKYYVLFNASNKKAIPIIGFDFFGNYFFCDYKCKVYDKYLGFVSSDEWWNYMMKFKTNSDLLGKEIAKLRPKTYLFEHLHC